MSALLTFLGGSAFRMLWGELSAAWTKHQDHKHEIEMLRLQGEQADRQHARMLELQKLTHEQGIKVIEAKSEATINEIEADAWGKLVEGLQKPTGVAWIDAWRASIQPALASIAILLWVSAMNANGFVMSEWDKELVAAILGVFVANRHLSSRGK